MNTLIFRIILVFIMACLCNIGYSQDKKISELTATSLVYSNDDFVVNIWNGSAYANKRVNASNLINSLINFPLVITNNLTATGDSNYLGTIFGDGTGLTGVQTAQTNIGYTAVTNAPWANTNNATEFASTLSTVGDLTAKGSSNYMASVYAPTGSLTALYATSVAGDGSGFTNITAKYISSASITNLAGGLTAGASIAAANGANLTNLTIPIQNYAIYSSLVTNAILTNAISTSGAIQSTGSGTNIFGYSTFTNAVNVSSNFVIAGTTTVASLNPGAAVIALGVDADMNLTTNAVPVGSAQTNISYVAITNAPWLTTNGNNSISGSNTITGPLHIAGPVTNTSTMVLTNAVATGTGYTGPTQLLLNQNATGASGYVLEYKTNNTSKFSVTTEGVINVSGEIYASKLIRAGGAVTHCIYFDGKNRWYSPADGTMVWTPAAGLGTTLMAFTNGTFYVTGAGSNIYAAGIVDADDYTTHSFAPDTLEEATRAVVSVTSDGNGKIDHTKLDAFLYGTKLVETPTGRMVEKQVPAVTDTEGKELEPAKTVQVEETVTEVVADQSKMSLGKLVASQAKVIQDLLKRIEALEKR